LVLVAGSYSFFRSRLWSFISGCDFFDSRLLFHGGGSRSRFRVSFSRGLLSRDGLRLLYVWNNFLH
jgi:hypothetical protein